MSHERKNCEMVKPSQREALLIYLRQCLFEQRVIGLFLGHERLLLARTFERWQHWAPEPAAVAAEGQRWQRKLASERTGWRETTARDAKALLQVRAHLSAAEEHIGQLQEECASLRRALTAADERGAAASAALAESAAATARSRTSVAEHAAARAGAARRLGEHLAREEARLASVSAQFSELELAAGAEEDELLGREHDAAAAARDELRRAIAAFASSRDAADGWAVVRALVAADIGAPRRRAALEESLEAARAELDGLRDGRDALDWRVREMRAQLILLHAEDDD